MSDGIRPPECTCDLPCQFSPCEVHGWMGKRGSDILSQSKDELISELQTKIIILEKELSDLRVWINGDATDR